ncbi:MAG: hypothetical protein WC213_07835 [Arenimonas sp.]
MCEIWSVADQTAATVLPKSESNQGKLEMKLKEIAFAVLLVMGLGACSAGDMSAAVDPQLAQKLTPDMPATEVRKLLGEPNNIQALKLGDAHVSDTWTYGEGDQLVTVVMIADKVSAAYTGTNNVPVFPEPVEALGDGDDGG